MNLDGQDAQPKVNTPKIAMSQMTLLQQRKGAGKGSQSQRLTKRKMRTKRVMRSSDASVDNMKRRRMSHER
jgi:hypothetical protein